MAIQVLGSLCLGVAHQPNKALQKEIASTDALDLLINFMLNPKNLLIKVSDNKSSHQVNNRLTYRLTPLDIVVL